MKIQVGSNFSIGEREHRQSGIELLKIIAAIMIVTAHCISDLNQVDVPATEFGSLVLQIMSRNFGQFANDIFFISSAWFLVDNYRVKLHKVAAIISDSFMISISFLFISQIFWKLKLNIYDLKLSICPILYSANWFITCYILIYVLHPLFNNIIYGIPRQKYLAYIIFLAFLYSGFASLERGEVFQNSFVSAVCIYFFVGYIKKYCPKFSLSRKINLLMFIIGWCSLVTIYLIGNYICLYTNRGWEKLVYFFEFKNPITITTAFSAFNLCKQMTFRNKIVNNLSSLTMLIYIIHQNRLFAAYVRPELALQFLTKYITENLLLSCLYFSAIVFLTASFIAALYRILLQRAVHKVASIMIDKVLYVYRVLDNNWYK